MNFEKNLFVPKNNTEETNIVNESKEKNIPNNILDQYSENPFETEMFKDAYDSLKRKRDLENEDKDAK